MSDRITISDVRRAGMCASGARAWFADRGLDFRDFVKNGMAIEDLEQIDDAHAKRLLEFKKGARRG